jgi:nucleotide-binding universal stress UspA family protein
MTFRRILCPIDFSPGSAHAMRAAIRLANEADAELVLAHAWYVPPMAYGSEYVFAVDVMREIKDSAQDALEAAKREATALGAKRLAAQLLTGSPRHEIVNLLEHDRAFDLVVVGTHGRTGLARVLLGSVAEGIVRHAPCSVLTVRPDREVRPFTRVLCPVDFSDGSQHAVDLAAELLPPEGAELTMLHVIDPPAVYTGGQRTVALVRDLDRYASEHLEKWAAQLGGKVTAPVTKLCRVGHPGAEILKVLDEGPAFDLVILGSHGRTGIERILLGSVAEKIVRHAPCPVLVARPRIEPR